MAIDDTRQKKESPYAPPAGRKETPEEKYERLENKNRLILKSPPSPKLA